MRRLVSFGMVALLPVAAMAQPLASDVALVPDVGGKIIAANGPMAESYLQAAACAFYKSHPDAFDALFVFSAQPMGGFFGTPTGITVTQAQGGIGKTNIASAASYCSKQLRHAVKMGELAKLPVDPLAAYDPTPGIAGSQTGLSGVQVMGHELGHHWMAYVGFDKGDGHGIHCELRAPVGEGTGGGNGPCVGGGSAADFGVHWSAWFDSGSVMWGNRVTDNGDGTFTFGNDGHLGFGALDRYLMGLLPADEVGPLLLVKVEPMDAAGYPANSYPVPPGKPVTLAGQRVDFTVDDVVRAQGARVPASDPCHWRGAAVLVHADGKPPSAALVNQVAAYAAAFEQFYWEGTGHLGSADLTIDGRGGGTPRCGATVPVEPGPEPVPDTAPIDAVTETVEQVPDVSDVAGESDATVTADVDVAGDPAGETVPQAAASGGCGVAPAGGLAGALAALVVLAAASAALTTSRGRARCRNRPTARSPD
jgi:hypothetical protein